MVTFTDLVMIIDDVVKRKHALKLLNEYETYMWCTPASAGSHHYYDGGLADHVMLTTILAVLDIKSSVSEIAVLYDLDDVIIASLFHELDKIPTSGVKTKFEIVEIIEKHGILNENVRDGILHSYGGYSPYQEKECGMSGIIVHKCCMIASRVFKSRDLTRKLIEDLSGYFCVKK